MYSITVAIYPIILFFFYVSYGSFWIRVYIKCYVFCCFFFCTKKNTSLFIFMKIFCTVASAFFVLCTYMFKYIYIYNNTHVYKCTMSLYDFFNAILYSYYYSLRRVLWFTMRMDMIWRRIVNFNTVIPKITHTHEWYIVSLY